MIANTTATEEKEHFIALSPSYIMPSTNGLFDVYLQQNGRMVLYTRKGELFNQSHRDKLVSMGITKIFVRGNSKRDLDYYVRKNIGTILADDSIPMEGRVKAWCDSSISMVHDLYDQKMPKPISMKRLKDITELIQGCTQFLTSPDALKQMSDFLRTGFETYHHGLGTMLFTTSVLRSYPEVDEKLMIRCAVGAMLHDIGKTKLPDALLLKDPAKLEPSEEILMHSHPVIGVGLCSTVPLSQESINCILFHHERMDGTGYPSGIKGNDIPFYTRVISVCNEYDMLTRTTNYHKAKSPFEALNVIKSQNTAYDMDVIKRLILILANAEIV